MRSTRTDSVVIRLARIVLTLAVLLASAPPAAADDLEGAKRHYSKGTKAYEIGAFDEAIREYGEAYRLIDDPALLFNLGQAHRLAGHPVEALRLYRMFLIKVPDSPNRTEVERRISELQLQIPAQPTAPPAAPAGSDTPTPRAADSTAAPTAPAIESTSHSPGRAAAARTKLIAGGVTAGVGVALVVTGVVFGVLAQNSGNDLTHDAQTGQPFDYNKQQTGKTDQILEAVLLAVGGAAVVAGTAVLIVGRRESSRARMHAWLRPSVGVNAVAATFEGRF